MSADGWKIDNFLVAKVFGTTLVIGFLIWLYRFRKSFAMIASSGVAGWQIFLLIFYLGVGDIMPM